MLSIRIFETDFTTALNEELERKNLSVKDLAELTGIPVVTSPNGKGSIDETVPIALGCIGRNGFRGRIRGELLQGLHPSEAAHGCIPQGFLRAGSGVF